MASVNIDRSVFNDPRYKALAKILGITKWDAIGRMVAVWDLCQETFSYVLSIENLNLLHDDVGFFADAVVKAGLGRKHRHGIYICGTKGRIEWLENKRRAAREKGKLGGRPKKTDSEPITNRDRLQEKTTPAPAPVPVPVQEKLEDFGMDGDGSPPPSPKKKPQTKISPDFRPDEELLEWAALECPRVDARLESANFVDYYRSKEERRADWRASWRTWMRNSEKWAREKGTPPLSQKTGGGIHMLPFRDEN